MWPLSENSPGWKDEANRRNNKRKPAVLLGEANLRMEKMKPVHKAMVPAGPTRNRTACTEWAIRKSGTGFDFQGGKYNERKCE
jgi:hypothetical protein